MSNPDTSKSARDWEYLREWLAVQAELSVHGYYKLRHTDLEKSRDHDMRTTHFEEVLRQMEVIDALPMQYRESPASPYVQAEIDRGLKLGKKAAEAPPAQEAKP